MDFSKLKRTSIFDRKSLVQQEATTEPPATGASFAQFMQALPPHLKVNDLRALLKAIHQARAADKPVMLMMGAHPIKVGLSRWLISAFEEGWFTSLTLNGASLVHDYEMALAGTTSEDVAESLIDGSFGMTQETGAALNQWAIQAAEANRGLGEVAGEQLAQIDSPHAHLSLLGGVSRAGAPITVHVALGAEVFHHHPEASGAALGQSSLHDFHRLGELVGRLGDGGVVLNVGSAVVLPEVFLKALTVARNLGGPIHHFTTANFDMIQHYRPNQNVVKRPVMGGGEGYQFTGHHEIMIPLLLMALREGLSA